MPNVFLRISTFGFDAFDIHRVENAFRSEFFYGMRLIEIIKTDSMYEQVQVEGTTLVQLRTHICVYEERGISELPRFRLDQRKHQRRIG
jgi:hypothetical protein